MERAPADEVRAAHAEAEARKKLVVALLSEAAVTPPHSHAWVQLRVRGCLG
jgi:hypothetical protein